jgi:antirestriction protein ArdC
MTSQNQLREEVNLRLMSALKDNTVPWRQAWASDVTCAMPSNILTKLPYRDINPILLRADALKNGYRSKWWGLEQQWKCMGGQILPSAKSTHIYQRYSDTVRQVSVYNLDSITGSCFDKLRPSSAVKSWRESVDERGTPMWGESAERGWYNIRAERVIKATGADFRELLGNEAAYYRPPKDYIVIPTIAQFFFGPGGPEAYYSTAFHELMHFTESRLGWLADPRRSIKDKYAIGEMRAEIGSAYLCAATGVAPTDKGTNHGKYLGHWLTIMGEDNSMIFRISHAASVAADYILSFSQKKVAA